MNERIIFVTGKTAEEFEKNLQFRMAALTQTRCKILEVRPVVYSLDSIFMKFSDSSEGYVYNNNFGALVRYKHRRRIHGHNFRLFSGLTKKIKNTKNKIKLRNKDS